MLLKELLQGADYDQVRGTLDRDVVSVGFDSRDVAPGGLFVAVRGLKSDGHAYIPQAVAAGAACVVCEELPGELSPAVTYIVVADSTLALAHISANFYGNPSYKLTLVGVTGTNGKTTIATLLYDMFRKLGYKAGLISTVIYKIEDREIPSSHTTPDSVKLNSLMAEMVEAGCEYCFMEVSSHSLVQHRTVGLRFAGGIFTNITHDHLDYHGTFAEYIKAKKIFFDTMPKGAFALMNADDRNASVMTQNSAATIKTYALRGFADFRCRIVESHVDGTLLNIDGAEVWVGFLGRFNAYNLLSVYGAAVLLGADKGEALRVLSELKPVNGRFDTLRSESGITAIVDYAHTPDALQNVIEAINEIRQGAGKLYVVVGCGGDRDRTKRPEMAAIAAHGSDMAILTSDNPRSERAEDIIEEMKAGLDPTSRYMTIPDRREAIRTAVMLASPGDIILVAGKGHETYQVISGVSHHFDDKEEVRAAFMAMGK